MPKGNAEGECHVRGTRSRLSRGRWSLREGGCASPAESQGVATIQEAGTYGVRPLPAYFRCALTSLVSSNIVT